MELISTIAESKRNDGLSDTKPKFSRVLTAILRNLNRKAQLRHLLFNEGVHEVNARRQLESPFEKCVTRITVRVNNEDEAQFRDDLKVSVKASYSSAEVTGEAQSDTFSLNNHPCASGLR